MTADGRFFSGNIVFQSREKSDKTTFFYIFCIFLYKMASKPPEPKKKKRSSRQEWLKVFLWLEFRNEGMRCTLCSKHKKMNTFTTEDCKDFQYSSLIRHQSSDGHQHSLKASKQASCLQMGFKSMATKSEESVVPQLRTVMFICQEGLALDKFGSLIELQRHNGL